MPKFFTDVKKLQYNRETTYNPQSFEIQGGHITLISEELFRGILKNKDEEEFNSSSLNVALKRKEKITHATPYESVECGITTGNVVVGKRKKKRTKKKASVPEQQVQAVEGHGVGVTTRRTGREKLQEEWPSLKNSESGRKVLNDVVPWKLRQTVTSRVRMPSLSSRVGMPPSLSQSLIEQFHIERVGGRKVVVKTKSASIAAKKKIPKPNRSELECLSGDNKVVHSTATMRTGMSSSTNIKRPLMEQKMPVVPGMAVKLEQVCTVSAKMALGTCRRKETSQIKKKPARNIGKKEEHRPKAEDECLEGVITAHENENPSQLREKSSATYNSKDVNLQKTRDSVPICEAREGRNLLSLTSEAGTARAMMCKQSLAEKASLVCKPSREGMRTTSKHQSMEKQFNPEPSKEHIRAVILEVMSSNGISSQRDIPCERKFDKQTVNPYSLRFFVTKELAWLSCPNCKSSFNTVMYCYIDLKTQKICHRFKKECKQCKHWMIPRFSPEAIEKMTMNSIRQFFIFSKRAVDILIP